jgi:hypothetical protein
VDDPPALSSPAQDLASALGILLLMFGAAAVLIGWRMNRRARRKEQQG